MDIPPPSAPESRLADWRQTDQTVASPFSTPMVTVYTHTLVFEESTQRERIHEKTGINHPWRFFFTSRIQFEPAQLPNPILTSLIRKRVDRAFVDRLAGRGLDEITTGESHTVSLGAVRGRRTRYTARLTVDIDGHDEPLGVPIEAYLTVWVDDGYQLAGGAYPAGRPHSGPSECIEALTDSIEPTAAREELFGLIAGCCES